MDMVITSRNNQYFTIFIVVTFFIFQTLSTAFDCVPSTTTIKGGKMATACSATTTRKCVPCEGQNDLSRLSLSQAQEELLTMMKSQPIEWTIDQKQRRGKEAKCDETPITILFLYRKFTAKNFQAALDAINAMGAIAEREGHHPNFHLTNYREVEVEIWTHNMNGLTRNDFVLAELLSSEVKIEYSPKWLREHPDAKGTSKDE
jgi:pterin-4a-carbinolamine dehydratase